MPESFGFFAVKARLMGCVSAGEFRESLAGTMQLGRERPPLAGRFRRPAENFVLHFTAPPDALENRARR